MAGVVSAIDVEVAWADPRLRTSTFAKVHQVIEGDHALRLLVKKRPSLDYDTEMIHVVSIPYTAMLWWKEKQ
jgi:hypothetical protein